VVSIFGVRNMLQFLDLWAVLTALRMMALIYLKMQQRFVQIVIEAHFGSDQLGFCERLRQKSEKEKGSLP